MSAKSTNLTCQSLLPSSTHSSLQNHLNSATNSNNTPLIHV